MIMKKIFNLKMLSAIIGALLLPLTVGCDDAEYSVIDNAIYLSEAYSSTSKKVSVDMQSPVVVTATVRATKQVENDMEATLAVSESALKVFNEKNGTNYVTLPETAYEFTDKSVTIPAGKVGASVAGITIYPVTQEMLDSGNTYALPVTIATAGGSVMESLQTMVYILDPVIITSVPVLTGSKPASMLMRQDYELMQWTVEFRINMSVLGTAIGEKNNQAVFSANGPSGNEIYIRFGDAPIAGNILQIKTMGTQINSPTPFNAKQWYHLAFVCEGPRLTIYIDGKADAVLDLPNKPILLDRSNFGICVGGSYLVADVMMSELRFWTKAISQIQIQNNMFNINPNTEGLEGYWKLNEGEGDTFNDATGHGNTSTATNGVVRWEHGIRSDGK